MSENETQTQKFMPGNWQLLKRCLGYFLPFKKHIVLSSLAMIIAGFCSAATAWLVKPALDDIFIAKNAEYLVLIPLAFLAVSLIDSGARLLQNYMMQGAGLGVLEKLREELNHKIILLPWSYLE